MGRLERIAIPAFRDEGGVTLVEMLVASVMLLIVISTAMTLLIVSSHSENTSQRYSQEIQYSEAGLSRMMHDIRQSSRVLLPVTATAVRFVLPGSTNYVVKYDCGVALSSGFSKCTRVQSVLAAGVDPTTVSLPATSSGMIVIPRIVATSSPIFGYTAPNQVGYDATGEPVDASGLVLAPTYVSAQVRVPANDGSSLAKMSHSTVLSSGAYLRYADVG